MSSVAELALSVGKCWQFENRRGLDHETNKISRRVHCRVETGLIETLAESQLSRATHGLFRGDNLIINQPLSKQSVIWKL